MTEQVIRHRGGGRDAKGKWTPGSDVPLTPIAIAPGGGTRQIQQARDGETIATTVYFALGTDLVNNDELTVRGERFSIIVNDWQMQGQGGLEVLCTRGEG